MSLNLIFPSDARREAAKEAIRTLLEQEGIEGDVIVNEVAQHKRVVFTGEIRNGQSRARDGQRFAVGYEPAESYPTPCACQIVGPER